MELLHFEKVKDGKYLKNYELTYLNKSGNEKKYEIVSRRDLKDADDLGGKPSRNTLRKLVEWKKLPVLKVGRKVLIKTDILEMFMEANEGRDLRDKGNVKAVTRNVAI